MHFSLASPQVVDGPSLMIFDVVSGHIEGDGISGEEVGPTGDWFSVDATTGIGTLDVRGSFKMDDGSFVYFQYGGRAVTVKEGEAPTYLVSTPLFRTSSVKYSFLTRYQYVAKMIDMKMPTTDEHGHITYKLHRVD